MKKLLLLLTALTAALLLAGCSVSELLDSVNSDKISNWLFSVTEVELSAVNDTQAIKDSLPAELSDLTVDNTSLGCQVTHLAIQNRTTDTTRQTDEVVCEVELEGSGIDARFTCTLYYTYTSNEGWGLNDWSINADSVSLEITEGALTEQLQSSCIADLEAEFGAGCVTYQSTSWDKDALVCSVVYDVDSSSGYLLTQGSLTISATLEPQLSKGLRFTWNIAEDDSTLLYGADLVDTTWLVSGMVDTTGAQLALSVSEFNIENQTVTFSAAVGVLEAGEYSYSIRYTDDMTQTYTVGKDGMITFSFELRDRTWDCCFDADDQWARMDGSYISTMNLNSQQYMDSDQLQELLSKTAEDDAGESLEYDTKTSGYTYTASDGTLVYELQVKYPQFSGNDVSDLNSTIKSAVSTFLDDPKISIDQSNLDSLAQSAAEGSTSLPYSSELTISVAYNQNGYLSLLYTYKDKVSSKKASYRYNSATYDLSTMEKLDDDDVYSGSSKEIGALIKEYSSTSYSDATVMSYVKAWTLGRNGLTFYLIEDDSTGECETVTIPYSESICVLNPTK